MSEQLTRKEAKAKGQKWRCIRKVYEDVNTGHVWSWVHDDYEDIIKRNSHENIDT